MVLLTTYVSSHPSPLPSTDARATQQTLHHIHFNCNYGQYFTLSDKLGGSFRAPAKGEDPLLAVLANMEKKKKQSEQALDKISTSPVMSADEELMSGASSSEGSEDGEVGAEERKRQ